jgi:hypothetical protein
MAVFIGCPVVSTSVLLERRGACWRAARLD